MLKKEISIKLSYLVASGFLIFIAILVQTQFESNALGEAKDFRALLEELQQLQEDEPGLLLFFQLVKPLSFMEEDTLSLPMVTGEHPLQNETWLGRIGDDYVCFITRGGQAVIERCVPFTNIASVDYLAGP